MSDVNDTEKLHWWLICLEMWNGRCYGRCEVTASAQLQYLSSQAINQIKESVNEEYKVPLKDVHIISISYLGEMTQQEWVGD